MLAPTVRPMIILRLQCPTWIFMRKSLKASQTLSSYSHPGAMTYIRNSMNSKQQKAAGAASEAGKAETVCLMGEPYQK